MKRKYISLIKINMMEVFTFRVSALATIIGNLSYMVVTFFLWKSIFESSENGIVNGMTFYDTMIYIVLATAMFNFMNCYVVWDMSEDYRTGKIADCLCKPLDYQAFLFWNKVGSMIISFVTTFLPVYFIVCCVTEWTISFGINVLLALVSVMFAIVINFTIDFCVGLICFYTESIWGINIMKEVVVAFLSGATIPLAFFPDKIRNVVFMFPFQAIYNTPLQILINGQASINECWNLMVVQFLWMVGAFGVSRILWVVCRHAITVNGG